VFAAADVEFMGHRVDQHGVWQLQRHMQAIIEFPPPQDVKQLQQFLGMVNFYRPFLPGIARTRQTLTDAVGGDPKTLEWPPAATFEAAKTALAAAVPLVNPAPNAVLSLARDASDAHVGGVLQQLARELAAAGGFYSKKLSGVGHQILHLRQGAAAHIQRSQALQIPTGREKISPAHSPQTTGHIPVPHHAALVSPSTTTAILHHRIYIGHQTHARPGECGGGRF